MPLDTDVVPEERIRLPRDGRRPARRRRRLIAGALVVTAVGAVVGGGWISDGAQRAVARVAADEPLIVSEKSLLADLWRDYRATYLEEATGRTLDLRSGTVTTARAEGYTLLRAVWMDDQETFARSWQWTKDNLKRDDGLLSGRFGELADGTYGVQEDGGAVSPSGADVDVAFALLMAYSRWQQDDYLYDALPLIRAVWERSVVVVDGGPVLAADDLQRASRAQVLVNPSSFAPYAFRVFAAVDPAHDWAGLVDSSYALLDGLVGDRLPGAAVGLPPTWVSVDRRTGEVAAAEGPPGADDRADATGLSWRLALDHRWYGDQRALGLLEEQSSLADTYLRHDRLATAFGEDGSPATQAEAPAVYGGAMGVFDTVRPDVADEVYTDELLPLYDLDTGDLDPRLSYEDANWVWFGMALHFDELPNLNVSEE